MTHPYTNPMDVSEDEQQSIKQSVRDTNLSKSNSPSRMSTPSYGRLDQCGTTNTLHLQHLQGSRHGREAIPKVKTTLNGMPTTTIPWT